MKNIDKKFTAIASKGLPALAFLIVFQGALAHGKPLQCPNMTAAFNDASEARYQLNELAYRNGNGQVAEAVQDLTDIKSDIRHGMEFRGCDISQLHRTANFTYTSDRALTVCPHKEKAQQLVVDAEIHLLRAVHEYDGLRYEARRDALRLIKEIREMLTTYGCR